MGKLTGKIAIITGGANGIGRAFCERYVDEGAKVIVADIDLEGAQAVAQALGPHAHGLYLDVTDSESIAAMIKTTHHLFGPPSILINNAAIFTLEPLANITRDAYQKTFSVNVEGLLFTMQAVANDMIAHDTRGAIINMASQAGGEASLSSLFTVRQKQLLSASRNQQVLH